MSKFTSLFCIVCLAGCAAAPTHNVLSDLVGIKENLIPTREFVTSIREAGGHSISPDGGKLAYWKRSLKIPYVSALPTYVKNLETGEVRKYPDLSRVGNLYWSGDSNTIIYNNSRKQDGTYHNQLIARDITTTEPNKTLLVPQLHQKGDLYFFKAVRGSATEFIAKLYTTDKDGKYTNPAYHKINYKTNTYTELAASDPNIYSWIISDDGTVAGRHIKTTSGFDVQWAEADGYRTLFSCEDSSRSRHIGTNYVALYFLSNCLSDKVALYQVDRKSYKVEIFYEFEDVDIDFIAVDKNSNKLLFATANADSTEITLFDERFSFLQDWLEENQPETLAVWGKSDDWKKFILVSSNLSGQHYWLVDTPTNGISSLIEPVFFKKENQLGDYQAIEIPMEDGHPVRAFLARPNIVAPDLEIPTVVYVHGGPLERSYPEYNPDISFLTNRGYAVLVVNYYGSTGYGKDYMRLPHKNFALLPNSISAAVNWLINKSPTDPDKIAIMGYSYGGYLSLLMPSLDSRFACSIAMNPVTDLYRMAIFDKEKFGEEVFNRSPIARYHGIDLNPNYKKWSPINQTDYSDNKILLIHAEDDRRVPIEQSEKFYRKFKSSNEIKFITLANESHGIGFWTNRLRILRESEKFLGQCLGGAKGGFDYYSIVEPLSRIRLLLFQ